LVLSKVEARKLDLQHSAVNVKQVLKNCLATIREKAKGKGINVNSQAVGMPDTIIADERILRQILNNLLSNVVKFTPDGGSVSLSVQFTDRGIRTGLRREDSQKLRIIQNKASGDKATGRTPQDCVEFAVSDNGIGIMPEGQSRIFNRFEQANGL